MHNLSEQAQYFAEIQDYLIAGAHDLFQGYGLPVEHALGAGGVNVAGPSIMAVIGYAAPTVRGALVIVTGRAIVAELQPDEIRVGSASDASLRDVLGEFSNMLVGRIKNRLIMRDVAPLLSTPTTIFGVDLELPAPKSGMSAWHRLSSRLGDIHVRLDATFDKDFTLTAMVDETNKPSITEGEMVLF